MGHCAGLQSSLPFKKNLTVFVVQALVALAEDLASIGSTSPL